MDSGVGVVTGSVPLLSVALDSKNLSLILQINGFLILILLLVIILIIWLGSGYINRKFKELSFDEAALGVGSATFKLKPNLTDRQVAYQIWVELSTRKIGIEIELDDDVVVEVYNSWHTFFGVTRDLIKTIPINKASSASTQKIIVLSIDILNRGLRPHLTKWQARFRSWYEKALLDGANIGLDPQDLQKRFPEFDALKADLLELNTKLIAYRRAMRLVAYGNEDVADDALDMAAMVFNETERSSAVGVDLG